MRLDRNGRVWIGNVLSETQRRRVRFGPGFAVEVGRLEPGGGERSDGSTHETSVSCGEAKTAARDS